MGGEKIYLTVKNQIRTVPIKSFYALIEKAGEGNYQFKQIRMPKYLSKDSYFSLIIPRIRIKDGYFNLPISTAFRKGHRKLRFNVPPNLEGKKSAKSGFTHETRQVSLMMANF